MIKELLPVIYTGMITAVASVIISVFKEEFKGLWTAWRVHKSVCKHYLDKNGRLAKKGKETKPTRIQILSPNQAGGVSWNTIDIIDSKMALQKDERGVLVEDVLDQNIKRRRVIRFKDFDAAGKAEMPE